MKKIDIVRLTDEEREKCLAVVKKLKGSSMKVRRANILLKSDADGPNWEDQPIADTFFPPVHMLVFNLGSLGWRCSVNCSIKQAQATYIPDIAFLPERPNLSGRVTRPNEQVEIF